MIMLSLSKRPLFALLITLGLLLLGTGCGGSSDGEGSVSEITIETGSLSKPEFIRRADKICAADVNKVRFAAQASYVRTESLGPRRREVAQRREATKLVNTVLVPAYEEQIERVSALGAPAGDEHTVAAILDALDTGIEEAEEEPLEFLQRASPFRNALRRAKAYGFTSCGGP